ncbi:MAG: hypothetical protein LLG93_07780, partial [Deltaproteobacteria bacterium]|nr:hypothetical protein [Deltaproteobacteria bacterium]
RVAQFIVGRREMTQRRLTHESGMADEFFVMEVRCRLGHQSDLAMANAMEQLKADLRLVVNAALNRNR